MRSLPRPVLIALFIVYVVWGSTYLAIAVALKAMPPFMLMGTRFIAAGALLFAWSAMRGAALPSGRQWRDAGIVGMLLLGGGMGLTAFAQQYVSSGMTAVFIACSPLILALWTGLFGKWPTPREWIGIAVGFSGALLLASGGEFAARPIGALALLGAVAAWNFGSVLSQHKLRLAPGAMGFASEMLLGGVALIFIALLRGETLAGPFTLPAVAAWAYLVVAGSLAAFTAYMYLLSHVSAALVSSYAYVNPIIAVILGATLGGETLGLREGIAMAVILSSVVLLTTAKSKTLPDAAAHAAGAEHT